MNLHDDDLAAELRRSTADVPPSNLDLHDVLTGARSKARRSRALSGVASVVALAAVGAGVWTAAPLLTADDGDALRRATGPAAGIAASDEDIAEPVPGPTPLARGRTLWTEGADWFTTQYGVTRVNDAGRTYALRPRDAHDREAVGVRVPLEDLDWWIAPEELAHATRWVETGDVTISAGRPASIDGEHHFTGRILLGALEGDALLARGRLGWRDDRPVLLSLNVLHETEGAELFFTDTPAGSELRAFELLAAAPIEVPVSYRRTLDRGTGLVFETATLTPDESRARQGTDPFWVCGLHVEFSEPWTIDAARDFAGHVRLCSDAAADVVELWQRLGLDRIELPAITLPPLDRTLENLPHGLRSWAGQELALEAVRAADEARAAAEAARAAEEAARAAAEAQQP